MNNDKTRHSQRSNRFVRFIEKHYMKIILIVIISTIVLANLISYVL